MADFDDVRFEFKNWKYIVLNISFQIKKNTFHFMVTAWLGGRT